MSTVIESLERAQLRRVPQFAAGDRVRVHFQVIEGTRRRTQVFEGVVIKRQGHGARETFTVRKESYGVGVERTFPVHSPNIDHIDVVTRGDVRREAVLPARAAWQEGEDQGEALTWLFQLPTTPRSDPWKASGAAVNVALATLMR